MNEKSSVDEFLSKKNIAVVGVSRKKKKFGDTIYKELKSRDYNVIPVNPFLDEYDQKKCYSSVKEINEGLDAAILVVKPEVTEKVVPELVSKNIKNIWIQQGSASDAAIKYCKDHDVKLVANECVLMFADPVKSIHSFHRWLWKVFDKLPK